LPLRGQHNWDNSAAAILATKAAGISLSAIESALPSFQALPHRLQRLPDQAGIKFYDDSISTVPDTAVAGIQSFTEPLHVLIGGSDKGLDPKALIDTLFTTPNIKTVVAIGATGPRVSKQLVERGFSKTILQGYSDLKTALQALKRHTQPGDVVLLSPGYASFGWYKNYKERGNDFAQLAAQWDQL
jgi:UDP-N-acetylmuramoylalanine--D-glutamate ligase